MQPSNDVPVTRAEIMAIMVGMFGDTKALEAYGPVIDMALAMAEGGPDNWQDPDSDHTSEVIGNLRFAINELTMVADALEEAHRNRS
jgi:hypothetical protein